jgi:FixJ family two-component response regulator
MLMSNEADLPYKPVVHIVDDDVTVRDGLTNLLRSAALPVITFCSPRQFIESWQASDQGCLVLDIHFPDGSGLDFQARLRSLEISMPVILMSGYADVPSSVRGMKAGAVDFLTKPFDDQSLLDAIAAALKRDAIRFQSETKVFGLAARYASLTSREREVFALVTKGLMNKQVAGKLNLSEITVKVHRGTMMRKMKMRTFADLVRASETLKSKIDESDNAESAQFRPKLLGAAKT